MAESTPRPELTLPENVAPVELERPCSGRIAWADYRACGSTSGYLDSRSGATFCARCGRNIPKLPAK